MTYTYSELAALMSSITATSNDAIVEQAYAIVAGREADADGKAYWLDRLETDLTPETLIAAMIRGAEAYKENNPGEDDYDIDTIAIKEQTAIELADAGVSADDIASALMGVTDIASANAAISAATGTGETGDDGESSFAGIIASATGGVTEGTEGADTIYMSAGQDFIFAGAGNDTIVARGNNTLTNADIIDGGAGDADTIEVMLDDNETAESPLVTNVEILKVQVQDNMDIQSGDNDVDADANDLDANIDAGDMSSVQQYWSEDSRADLTIEDISRNSHITTLGMRETDPGDVDYAAYFDPENITAPGATESGATLLVKMANVLQVAEGGNPVENFTTFSFSVDTTNVVVDVSEATDYDDVVDAIEAAAAEAGLDLTVEKQAATNAYFSIDITGSEDYEAGDLAGTYNPILITNNGAGTLVKGSFATAEDATDAAYTNSMSTGAAASTPALTQVDVIFDRVGKNSQGGDFVAGSDSTGDSGSAGIQQFNVQVDRDSWLTSVSSTNNTLEVVNVENIEENSDGEGSLTVDLIQNIRVFDGSTMDGDADITVTLNEGTAAKYLDNKDDGSNPADDNSEDSFLDVVDTEFSYDFGNGDDTFDLTIDNSNLAQEGTTTREDFVLEIRGGNGNDTIDTMIEDGSGTDATNWYLNSKAMANLEIDAGAGNDTITTKGAGDWTIDAGNGNDTVYTDNIGVDTEVAKWLVNTDTRTYADLNADTIDSRFMVNATLTVTLSASTADANNSVTDGVAAALTNGFEVTAEIPSGANYTVTSLHINQAIKDAINNDAVLSKLLVAQDVVGGGLEIVSKIDGVFNASDLLITVASDNVSLAANYTASEQTSIAEAYQEYMSDSTLDINDAQTANAASVLAFNADPGMTNNQQFGSTGTGLVVSTAAETADGVDFVAEVDTLTITADAVADGDETVTVTYDADGATGAVTGTVLVDLTGVDVTDATLSAAAIRTALNNDAGFQAVAVASGTGADVVVTYSVVNAGPNNTLTTIAQTAGTYAAGTSVIGTGNAVDTTDGVLAVANVDTFAVSGLSIADDATLTFVVDGSELIYTNDSGGALTGNALEADILADLGATHTINGVEYTIANAGGTDDLTITQTGAFTQWTNIAASTAIDGTLANGTASAVATDNTVTAGAGDDVIVLSTSTQSNDTLVFSGTFDNDTVVNFVDAGAGADTINFRAYLGDLEYNDAASTSETSKVRIATTDSVQLSGAVTVDHNEVIIINDFNGENDSDISNESWANLTATNLLAALNDEEDYGDTAGNELENGATSSTSATNVSDTVNSIIMIENDLNEGEYKVFHVVADSSAADGEDFTSATLVGTIDFGAQIDNTVVFA